MKRRDVPLTHGLLPRRLGADGLDGQATLEQSCRESSLAAPIRDIKEFCELMLLSF